MIIASDSTISAAWLLGTETLLAAGGDAFSSILHVVRPAEPTPQESSARGLLDAFLARHRMQDTQTVASTIFPDAIAVGRTAAELYGHYETRTFPRLRRLRANTRGTYFHRLIHLETTENGTTVVRNPLAECIQKMRGELRRRGTLRSAYELAIYRPKDDASVRMGFPCLSHISLKVDPGERQLHLSAVYRNQTYVERAYGNLLGLNRLQGFIAHEVRLDTGELVCHATHAELGAKVRRGPLTSLLADIRAVLSQPPSWPRKPLQSVEPA